MGVYIPDVHYESLAISVEAAKSIMPQMGYARLGVVRPR